MADRKFAGPTAAPESRFTKRDGLRAQQAAGRRFAREQGLPWPLPPGKVVGVPPADLHTNPVYGTHAISELRETAVRGEYLLEVTAEMEALPAGTERVDGQDIEVPRAGTKRSRNTFPSEPEIER